MSRENKKIVLSAFNCCSARAAPPCPFWTSAMVAPATLPPCQGAYAARPSRVQRRTTACRRAADAAPRAALRVRTTK